MSYQTRLTLDYDGYHPRMRFDAIRAYHALVQAADEVEVRLSTSDEGIHLVGFFEERMTIRQQIRFRRHYSDDWNRVRLDDQRIARGHTGNVLWSEKDANDGSPTLMADIYDALDHLDRTGKTDYERIHALANEGHRACTEMAAGGLNSTKGAFGDENIDNSRLRGEE